MTGFPEGKEKLRSSHLEGTDSAQCQWRDDIPGFLETKGSQRKFGPLELAWFQKFHTVSMADFSSALGKRTTGFILTQRRKKKGKVVFWCPYLSGISHTNAIVRRQWGPGAVTISRSLQQNVLEGRGRTHSIISWLLWSHLALWALPSTFLHMESFAPLYTQEKEWLSSQYRWEDRQKRSHASPSHCPRPEAVVLRAGGRFPDYWVL